MQIAIGELAQLVMYFMVLVMLIYGLALGYHWLTYGADRKTATMAIVVYGIGSGALLLGLLTAYNFF